MKSVCAMEIVDDWICDICTVEHGWDAERDALLKSQGFDGDPCDLSGNLPKQAVVAAFWKTKYSRCLVADYCGGICIKHLKEVVLEMEAPS